jgi:hypothetical protein
MGSGKQLKRAIKKYGISNFEKKILATFEYEDQMFAAEAAIVNESFIARKDTYNIKIGGLGGWDHLNGNITVKDQAGKMISVSRHDPRYLSGELRGIAYGKMTAKDKFGNLQRIDVSDPRYLSGELVHHLVGRMTVKDKDDQTMSVSIDDPRYLSGELVGATKGRKPSPELITRLKVINSNRQSGSGNSMFGKMWITSPTLKRNTRIDRGSPIPNGWFVGRKKFLMGS